MIVFVNHNPIKAAFREIPMKAGHSVFEIHSLICQHTFKDWAGTRLYLNLIDISWRKEQVPFEVLTLADLQHQETGERQINWPITHQNPHLYVRTFSFLLKMCLSRFSGCLRAFVLFLWFAFWCNAKIKSSNIFYFFQASMKCFFFII